MSNETYNIVSTVLIILGWIIASLFTVKQVQLAHDKNRALQQELIDLQIRNEMLRSVIHILTNLQELSGSLRNHGMSVILHMKLAETQTPYHINWQPTIEDLNSDYQKFSYSMDQLNIMSQTYAENSPIRKQLNNIYAEFEAVFVMNISTSTICHWMVLQQTLLICKKTDKPNSVDVIESWEPIAQSLDKIRDLLSNSSRMIYSFIVAKT